MSKIVMNPAALSRLLKDGEGPVGNYLYKRGRGVEKKAYRNVNNPGRGRTGKKPKVRTGDLRDNIFTSQPAVLGGDLAVVVGSDATHKGVAYPLLLEKGGVARFRIRFGPNRGKPATKKYHYPWLTPAFEEEFRGRR